MGRVLILDLSHKLIYDRIPKQLKSQINIPDLTNIRTSCSLFLHVHLQYHIDIYSQVDRLKWKSYLSTHHCTTMYTMTTLTLIFSIQLLAQFIPMFPIFSNGIIIILLFVIYNRRIDKDFLSYELSSILLKGRYSPMIGYCL